ncbi:MAG: helix-turn-helix transcriptional regulator [Desulfurivibrionaceae bacterium]
MTKKYNNTDSRLIRLPEVEHKIGYKKSKIYNMIKQGLFPSPVEIGPRARAWIEAEVVEWINTRPRAGKVEEVR